MVSKRTRISVFPSSPTHLCILPCGRCVSEEPRFFRGPGHYQQCSDYVVSRSVSKAMGWCSSQGCHTLSTFVSSPSSYLLFFSSLFPLPSSLSSSLFLPVSLPHSSPSPLHTDLSCLLCHVLVCLSEEWFFRGSEHDQQRSGCVASRAARARCEL